MGMWVIGIVFAGIGWLVQSQLKKKFALYSKTQLLKGWSGREVAEKMLSDSGIYDVKVVSVNGQLTDHYNPVTKTVNLSTDVYHGHSTASAAVAAHECGHAVQHATSYAMLGLRSKIVPVVNIASTVMPWLLMFGVMLLSRVPGLLLVAIAAQAIITAFTLVTLPVEFDASRRALVWLESKGVTVEHEHTEAKDALKWAALTYVVSALAAVTQLIFLIMRYSSSRR
jgi:Zn-dependent membrane protease YugP